MAELPSAAPAGVDPATYLNFLAKLQYNQQQQGSQAGSDQLRLLMKLIEDSQNKYQEAHNANEQTRNDILKGRTDTRNRILDLWNGYGDSITADTNKKWDQNLHHEQAQLRANGLGSSTVLPSIQNQNLTNRQNELRRNKDDIIGNYAGADERLSNNVDDFLERITNAYPDQAATTSLAGELGKITGLPTNGIGSIGGLMGSPNVPGATGARYGVASNQPRGNTSPAMGNVRRANPYFPELAPGTQPPSPIRYGVSPPGRTLPAPTPGSTQPPPIKYGTLPSFGASSAQQPITNIGGGDIFRSAPGAPQLPIGPPPGMMRSKDGHSFVPLPRREDHGASTPVPGVTQLPWNAWKSPGTNFDSMPQQPIPDGKGGFINARQPMPALGIFGAGVQMSDGSGYGYPPSPVYNAQPRYYPAPGSNQAYRKDLHPYALGLTANAPTDSLAAAQARQLPGAGDAFAQAVQPAQQQQGGYNLAGMLPSWLSGFLGL
jgi:hypothetical protein